MRTTLRKDEVLRGYDVFSSVVKNGTKFRGGRIMCFAVTAPQPMGTGSSSPAAAGSAAMPVVRVGFAVARRRVPLAADRNRVKRLLREVYRTNREKLTAGAAAAAKHLDLVLMIPEAAGKESRRLKFSDLETDWNLLVPKLIDHLGRH